MEFHEPDWCQVLGRVERRLFHTMAWGLFAAFCAYLWHEGWIDRWSVFPLPDVWQDENTWALGLQAGGLALSYALSYVLVLLLFAGLPVPKTVPIGCSTKPRPEKAFWRAARPRCKPKKNWKCWKTSR
jgi:hypothetical protein